MRTQPFTRILPDTLVALFCMASIGLSIIESRLNTDAFHWGLMYASAADLHAGFIPYREIYIPYGFLTTLLQSWSLDLFGNTVVSVGIITGIFYAVSIFLSYCLWQRILNPWMSALSALLMFLVHGYIIYPWANYFSYTFFLISLLLLTRSPPQKTGYLLTGIFLGLSYLARQSPLPMLLPIYLYFLLTYISSNRDFKKTQFKNIAMFHAGLLGVIALFFIYLLQESAFKDWTAQSFTILGFFKSAVGGTKEILKRFLHGLILAEAPPERDVRSLLYTLVFFNTLVIFGIVFLKMLRKQISEREKVLLLFSMVILFGYLRSAHLYEVFRLQSASSLGFGLLLLSLHHFSTRFKQWKSLVFAAPVICLFIFLGQTLVFAKTTSVYYPWNRNLLSNNQLKEPENIGMLKHSLYDEKVRVYYQTIAGTMTLYAGRLEFLVNLTADSHIPMLSKSFKKTQRAPFYNKYLADLIFQDEQEEILRLLSNGKAVLAAEKPNQIPENYEVVLKLDAPDAIPWIDYPTYIAVPRNMTASLPPDKGH